MTPEFMCQQAKRKLSKTDIVGITEDMNSVLYQLHYHTHLVPRHFSRFPPPVKKRKSHLDEEATRIMEDWGKYDQDLYEHAKVIYEKQKAIAMSCIGHHKG